MTTEAPEDKILAQFYRDLEAIENRRSSWNGPCRECKFFSQNAFYNPAYCENPIVVGTHLDPVTGKVVLSRDMECRDARNDEIYIGSSPGDKGVCGRAGKFFLPKPPPPPAPEPEEDDDQLFLSWLIVARYVVAAIIGMTLAVGIIFSLP